MKILSFDIGIKNLAYCLGEYDNNTNKLSIIEWKIINLLEDEINNQEKCSHISKMRPYKQCSKIALYKLRNNKTYYCKTHLKNYNYTEPEISGIITTNICNQEECNKKVKYLVDGLELCASHKKQKFDFYKNNYIIKKIKNINCSTYPIDKVADRMIYILDTKYEHLLKCDRVLLELQPLKSPRIKSISNYLSMYYRMNGKHYKKNDSNILEVQYIMATNKLKFNENNTNENIDNYKNRKKTGIENVNDYFTFIQDNENKEWFNKQRKKDDLADSLLQILFYLQRNYNFK